MLERIFLYNCCSQTIMAHRDEDKSGKAYSKLRGIMDSSMGGVYVFFGIAVFLAPRLGWDVGLYYRISLGGILSGYGIFRMYRGVKRFF